jgi:hypothetical protein
MAQSFSQLFLIELQPLIPNTMGFCPSGFFILGDILQLYHPGWEAAYFLGA